ncbi:MAG: curli assembly protein CsgF [Pseudomonadota bacterium]
MLVCTMAMAGAAHGDLVYSPNNPSFGGNPNAGAVMLNNAQTQDSTGSSAQSFRREPRTARQQFEEQLQRTLLNQISRSLNTQLFDDDGNLVPGERFDAGDFEIEISEDADGNIEIITRDSITGDETRFSLGQGGF